MSEESLLPSSPSQPTKIPTSSLSTAPSSRPSVFLKRIEPLAQTVPRLAARMLPDRCVACTDAHTHKADKEEGLGGGAVDELLVGLRLGDDQERGSN
jgi:hypothetical protein